MKCKILIDFDTEREMLRVINKDKGMISENIDVILTPFSVLKNFR